MPNYMKPQVIKMFFTAMLGLAQARAASAFKLIRGYAGCAIEFAWKHSGRAVDVTLSVAIFTGATLAIWGNYSDNKPFASYGLLTMFFVVFAELHVATIRSRRATELLNSVTDSLVTYRERQERFNDVVVAKRTEQSTETIGSEKE